MRYIDSASRTLSSTIHGWLLEHLPKATKFACQSGYYRYDALAPFAPDVRRMLKAGGTLDLVVGANESRLSATDLEETLALLEPWSGQVSFTLVGARDGLFHPKTYYVEVSGGERAAAVGSANFTVPGTGHHVEACLLLNDADDDPAILDAIRDAVLSWPARASTGGDEAQSVTLELIQDLAAERAIDPVPPPPPRDPRGQGAGTRGSFPALPRIPGAPRSRTRPRPRSVPQAGLLAGAKSAFPAGAAGIIKRLSKTDLKGFTGEGGTPYIALPPAQQELAARLPMQPYGLHQEPRLDVLVEARLDGALASVVNSGTDTTNITHVGMGATRRSNVDLRFNLLHGIHAGLIYVASQANIGLPTAGDAAAIEFLDGGRFVRVTFVTAEPLRSSLLSHLLSGRAWGWLPAGTVPRW